jgi:3-deoxy-7-phosphoheptulonate synthase
MNTECPTHRWDESLPAPGELCSAVPLSAAAASRVVATRDAIRDVLHGRDRQRLVVVVGPCSIHDSNAALEYAARLRPVLEETSGEIVGLMRTYLEKPRTALGWKGFVKDPRLDGSGDLRFGLERGRALLLEILELGVPCAAELLDPLVAAYIEDLLSWTAVGARTIESQPHREMASGLPMPVGFKNGTGGCVDDAIHAMSCARRPQSFLGLSPEGNACLARTTGNPDRHLVLRGGGGRPNYFPEDVAHAAKLARDQGVERSVMVDCSHANSGKDHTRQAEVCRTVLDTVQGGSGAVLGLLIESNLEAGSQPWAPGRPLRHGVSITDSCLGFAETADLLYEIARSVCQARREGLDEFFAHEADRY